LTFLRWQLTVTLAFAAAAVLSGVPFDASPELKRLEDFQSHAILFGFLATVLALTAALMTGHVLQHLDSVLSEKRDLYLRLREVLMEFDKFLGEQNHHLEIVQSAQSLSWEAKKLRMADFPIRDWDERVKSFINTYSKYPESAKDPNLHLKTISYVNYCEELVGSLGLCCIRQVVARVLLRPIVKMFALLTGIIAVFAYYHLYFSSVHPMFLWGAATFFTVGTALLTYEVAYWLYRHISETSDEVIAEKNQTTV